MLGNVLLTWRGKPIYDAKKWARDRGQQMVRYDVWSDWFGVDVYSHTEEVPEAFFDNMRFTADYRNVRSVAG